MLVEPDLLHGTFAGCELLLGGRDLASRPFDTPLRVLSGRAALVEEQQHLDELPRMVTPRNWTVDRKSELPPGGGQFIQRLDGRVPAFVVIGPDQAREGLFSPIVKVEVL